MVARSTQTVMTKPKPPQPQDDIERLRKLSESLHRHAAALSRAVEEICQIEERRKPLA